MAPSAAAGMPARPPGGGYLSGVRHAPTYYGRGRKSLGAVPLKTAVQAEASALASDLYPQPVPSCRDSDVLSVMVVTPGTSGPRWRTTEARTPVVVGAHICTMARPVPARWIRSHRWIDCLRGKGGGPAGQDAAGGTG